MKQIFDIIEAVAGRTLPCSMGLAVRVPPSLVADASHAREIRGWKPKYSGVEAITHNAWNWYLKETANQMVSSN